MTGEFVRNLASFLVTIPFFGNINYTLIRSIDLEAY